MVQLDYESASQPPDGRRQCSSRDELYSICRGQELSPKTMFKRIGIIPYFMKDEMPFFFLMVDANFNEITDAGGLSYRREKWARAASRETREETRGIFNYSITDIENRGIVVYRHDYSIAIVFMQEPNMTFEDSLMVTGLYQASYREGISMCDRKETLENSSMIVLSIQELSKIIKAKPVSSGSPTGMAGEMKVYRPVRFILRHMFKNFLNDVCKDAVKRRRTAEIVVNEVTIETVDDNTMAGVISDDITSEDSMTDFNDDGIDIGNIMSPVIDTTIVDESIFISALGA